MLSEADGQRLWLEGRQCQSAGIGRELGGEQGGWESVSRLSGRNMLQRISGLNAVVAQAIYPIC